MAEQKREHFSDKPTFLPDLHKWVNDPTAEGARAPDPRLMGRADEEFMRLLDQMLGPGGYMKYKSALNAQRGVAAPPAPPAPTMTPTQVPTNNGIDNAGFGFTDKTKSWLDKLLG